MTMEPSATLTPRAPIIRSPQVGHAAYRVPAPTPLRNRWDAEEFSKRSFVWYAANRTPPGSLVLDAGGGTRTHAAYFPHATYESCDLVADPTIPHDYICDVKSIPVPEGRFDTVLCIQVLDDVPDPQAVIDEFFRILRPGGSLFLTAPMSGRLHNEPYHFFQFTRYGLDLLFRRAGFEVRAITPRGGAGWYLNYMCRKVPDYLRKQLPKACAAAANDPAASLPRRALLNAARLIAMPAYWLTAPLTRAALPWLCFHLDAMDHDKAFTLGYACDVVKPEA